MKRRQLNRRHRIGLKRDARKRARESDERNQNETVQRAVADRSIKTAQSSQPQAGRLPNQYERQTYLRAAGPQSGGNIVRLTDEEDELQARLARFARPLDKRPFSRVGGITEQRASDRSSTVTELSINDRPERVVDASPRHQSIDLSGAECQEDVDRPDLSDFISREDDELAPHDELDPPPANMRRLSYLNRSAAVYKIPLNDSSYLVVSSNSVSPASACSHHQLAALQQQQQQVAQKQQTQPVIIVEPHGDDSSLRCNCRNCQFLSGWCCMPSVLFIVLVVVIFWLFVRGNESALNNKPSQVANSTLNSTAEQAELLEESSGFSFFSP